MPCPYGLDIPAILLHYNKCLNEGNIPENTQDENYRKARRAYLVGYDRSVPKLRQASHCIGCNQCSKNGCVFTDDGVNDFIAKARQADGFVFGTPVYYAHPSGRVLSFLDRVFYAGGSAFAGKPGAAVASARRAGTTASLDALGKYFGISNMVTVGSTYWNMVHGHCPEDVMLDGEGLQTMRNLGRSMAWLLHCIQAGREAGYDFPAPERGHQTNFIR